MDKGGVHAPVEVICVVIFNLFSMRRSLGKRDQGCDISPLSSHGYTCGRARKVPRLIVPPHLPARLINRRCPLEDWFYACVVFRAKWHKHKQLIAVRHGEKSKHTSALAFTCKWVDEYVQLNVVLTSKNINASGLQCRQQLAGQENNF